jgi:hypothetical protein
VTESSTPQRCLAQTACESSGFQIGLRRGKSCPLNETKQHEGKALF